MFVKYQHIERLGTSAVEGIMDGICYIFPKLDGANSSVWIDYNVLQFGSRNRQLTLDNDNSNFMNAMLKDNNITKIHNLLLDNNHFNLFGEWLVPHTIKGYRHNAWKQFYIFDVYNNATQKYIPYESYIKLLQQYDIDNYIPPICKIENPTIERLQSLAKNNYLLENETDIGEGIVIKNYDFINKFGNTIFAKIVNSEFKDKNLKFKTREICEVETIECKIIQHFVTDAFILKEYNKIAITGWDSAKIPMLFETIYKALLDEEIYNISKKYKQPKIDFKLLYNLIIKQVKSVLKDLF